MCSVSLCASGLSNLICGTVSFWHFLFLPGFLGMAHSAAHERCTNNKATRVSLPHHFVEFDSVLYYYYYNCYHHHYYLSFLIFSIILVIIITIYIHIYIYIYCTYACTHCSIVWSAHTQWGRALELGGMLSHIYRMRIHVMRIFCFGWF